MIRLALAQLRRRPLRYISLFFSIAIAVSLTVATAAISQSLRDSVHSLYTAPYESADVVAGLHNATPDQARRLQAEAKRLGATNTALDQQVVGTKKSGSAQLYQPVRVEAISSGPLMWQNIIDGRAPERPGEVLLSAPDDDSTQSNPDRTKANIGETIMLNLPTRGSKADVPVKVVGHTQPSATEKLIGTESLYAFPSDVATWAGPAPNDNKPVVNGELRIALPNGANASEFAQKLQQRAGNSIQVATADSRAQTLADQYFGKRDHYFVLLDAFVAVVAIVAALVIFSSYQVLAAQRRREFALIRSIGTGQLVSSVIVEAAVLAAIAGVLAAPFGLWLASFAGRHASVVGVRVPLSDATLSPLATFAVALVGVGLAVLAAVPAAWMAARRPVVESLSTSESGESSRVGLILTALVGVAIAASGLWLGQRMSNAAADGAVSAKRVALAVTAGGLVVLGAMLLFAVIWPLVLGLFGRVVKLPVLQLALSYAGRQRLRAGALVTIIFAGSALVGAVVTGQDKVAGRLEEKAASKALADVAISSVDGPIPDGLVEKVRRTPGVTNVAEPQTVRMEGSQPARDGGAAQNTPGENVLSGSETAYTLSAEDARTVLRDETQGAQPGEVVLGRYSPWREELKTGDKISVFVGGQPVQVKVRLSDSQFTLLDQDLAQKARQAAKDAKLREAGLDPANSEAVQAFEQRTGKTVPDFPVTMILAMLGGGEKPSASESRKPNPRDGAPQTPGNPNDAARQPGFPDAATQQPNLPDAATQEAAVKRVRETVDAFPQKLVLKDGVAYRKAGTESVNRVLTVSRLMILASVLITLLGVLNVLLLTLTERRRDRELLRSVGLGPARGTLSLALEVLLLAGAAALLGWWLGSVEGLMVAGFVLA